MAYYIIHTIKKKQIELNKMIIIILLNQELKELILIVCNFIYC